MATNNGSDIPGIALGMIETGLVPAIGLPTP